MIGDRIYEELEHRDGQALVAGDERDDRGEVAARTVASERDAVAIATQLAGVGRDPFPCGNAVVDRAGEPRLGCEAIVDRHDDRSGLVAQHATEVVVRIE